MPKHQFIHADIYDVIADYIMFCEHIQGDHESNITLTTIRNIILGRYRREYNPEKNLNFVEQCFVRCKADQLHIKPEQL